MLPVSSVVPIDGQKRILIVDDDDDFSAAIAEILDSEGYVFRRAHNAHEARDAMGPFDAHVALVDIRLGRDNGIELIEQLKQLKPDLLCVMMTGHAALDTAIQALQHGAYNYLRKPIDGLDLLSTLERCFDRLTLESDKRRAELELGERNTELVTLSVRLRGVVESTQRLAGIQDLAVLIPLLHEELEAAVSAERSAIYLARADRFERARGDANLNLPAVVSEAALRESAFYDTVESHRPSVIADTASPGAGLPAGWEDCGRGSLMVLPFASDGGTSTGLAVLWRAMETPFGQQDKDLGALLSSVCSGILRGAEASFALQESEQRYRLLADNVADVIWTADLDGRISYISPSIRPICGFDPDDFVGKPLESWMPEQSTVAVRALLASAANGEVDSAEEARSIELPFRTEDGSTTLMETRCIGLRAEDGPVSGLLAVSRDVSERKHAEEARSRLAAAVEHAAESIIITDPQGIIQYVNPAFERLLGYGREETIGKTPWILRKGKLDDREHEKLWQTLTAGEVWQGRFSNQTKSGRHLEQEATISAIRGGQDEIINYVCVARDVTHEIELETQLRQAQKMEAIGTLAGGIAHDFNNMLSPILGYTELAMMTAGNGSPITHYLQEIHSAGKRASELVRQILAFGRRSEQEQRHVAMDGIVNECMQLLRGSLPSTISIEVHVHPAPMVWADPTQIHQVIMNLCTNAYHAMRETGGVLAVELRGHSVSPRGAQHSGDLPAGEYIRLAVSDTGQGMDEETIDRIFEPYFTTKKVGEGTGLGLAMVHGIVKAHHGHLTVSSAPNSGTTFEIFLPAAVGADSAMEPESSRADGEHGNQHILVVDDEPTIVDLMQRGLEILGYRVTGFSSSLEALEALAAAPTSFDLLLTDQTMPGMTGIELAQRAMALRPGLPVILATGYSDSVNESMARRAGVREFLFKPISPRAIAVHIQDIFRESGV